MRKVLHVTIDTLPFRSIMTMTASEGSNGADSWGIGRFRCTIEPSLLAISKAACCRKSTHSVNRSCSSHERIWTVLAFLLFESPFECRQAKFFITCGVSSSKCASEGTLRRTDKFFEFGYSKQP
jgi:hypothetical protein